jgi:hypothetical protein
LVRRDKEASNLAKLTESGNSPAVLWEIANAAVGKPCQPLPTSVMRADENPDWEGIPEHKSECRCDLWGRR